MFSYPYFLYIFKTHPKRFLKSLVWFLLFLNLASLLVFKMYPNLYLPFYDPHRGRLYGPLFDPNFYAVYLLGVSLFVLDYFIKTKSKISVISLIISFVSIYLTYSRAGILALFLVLLLYLIKTKNVSILLAILGFIFILLSSPVYLSRFLFVEGNLDSFILRLQSYYEGLSLFSTSYIPFGFNNIKIYKYFLSGATSNSSAYTDSLVFNLLLTGGIFNVLFLVLSLYALYKKKIPSNTPIYLVPFLLTFTSFVFNTFFQSYFILLLIWSFTWLLSLNRPKNS